MIITNRKGPRTGLPIVELLPDTFDKLTTPPNANDLKYMPLGSWIRCKEKDGSPSPTVIGQLVSGENAIAAQWGAGMSLPERFLNRYETEIKQEYSI